MFNAAFYRAMTPSAGAFLACVGACLFVSAFEDQSVRYAMLTIGFVSGVFALVATAFLARRRGLPPPSASERLLIWPPVIGEIAVFWILSATGVIGHDPRTFWLVALAITGIHFMPMYWSLGPAIVLLGGLCLASALTGFALEDAPLGLIIATDGAFKLVIGLMMFAGAFRSNRTALA
jgi:hypothetical protein